MVTFAMMHLRQVRVDERSFAAAVLTHLPTAVTPDALAARRDAGRLSDNIFERSARFYKFFVD
jgi:hypothetical protein